MQIIYTYYNVLVVIDWRDNKNAATGAFEMVYKQNCPPVPPYLGTSLCVRGRPAYRPTVDSKSFNRKSKDMNFNFLSRIENKVESTQEEMVPASNPSVGHDTSSTVHNVRILNTLSKKNLVKEEKVEWLMKKLLKLDRGDRQEQSTLGSQNSSTTSLKEAKSFNEEAKNLKVTNQDEILKLFGSLEVKDFINNFLVMKKALKEKNSENIVDVEGIQVEINDSEECLKEATLKEKLNYFLDSLQNILERNSKTNEWSKILDDIKDNSFVVSYQRLDESSSDFEIVFERELKDVESKEHNLSNSNDSFLTASSCQSGCISKTSLEYFQNWKSKVNVEHETWEKAIMLMNSCHIENSKARLIEESQKSIKHESDFVDRIKVLESQCKHSMKSEKGDETDLSCKNAKRLKKNWSEMLNLTISSETGSVTNIGKILPVVKQRSRSLLPNGSSGMGRKI